MLLAALAGLVLAGEAVAILFWGGMPDLSCGPPAEIEEGMVHIVDDSVNFYIDRYEFPNKKGKKPTYMTELVIARKACVAAGKRLCTDAEWRRACLGRGGDRRFSYGKSYVSTACNTEQGLESGHSGMVNNRGQDVALSGAREQCRSEEGVFDMVGNLEEWVLSSWQGRGAALEGGAWFTYTGYADCSGRYSRQPNYRFNPTIEIFSAGFRCCWSSAAPTEEELTADDLALDTRARMARARGRESRVSYHSANEVQVAPGLWVDRLEYPNRAGVFPRVGVSYKEAAGLCAAAGKRVCTTAEWTLACGGPAGWPHPVGKHLPPPGTCPSGLPEPVASGTHRSCATPGGVMDLLGGVWEWSATAVAAPPHIYPEGTVLRQVLGGSWANPEGEERCNASEGYAAVPEGSRFPEMGFRCCRGKAQAAAAPAVARPGRCGAGMVQVDDFCVDVFEHPNRPGHVPVANLNLDASRKACEGRGLRLCTAKQWERACTGGRGRAWPYGSSYQLHRCNYALVKHNDLPEASPSGTYPGCVSADGVFDLSGNLWEWVDVGDGRGEMRGGGLNVSAGYGGCQAAAYPHPDFQTFETGTRCCGPLQKE